MVLDFLKARIVSKFYTNFSMNFFNILIPFVFSAATTLTSRRFLSQPLLLNYLVALVTLFFCFLIPVLHSFFLNYLKSNEGHNTDDCYLGYKRSKEHSEAILFMYMISQLMIPCMIPLFHPLATVLSLILFHILNIALLVQSPILEIKGCTYIRVVHELICIMFNAVFLGLFLLETYFSLYSK